MTAHLELREQLADEYVAHTRGMIVDPWGGYSAQSPPLMHSYLQYLTGRRIPMMKDPDSDGVPNAIDWDSEAIGKQLNRWADYTPGPYVPVGHKHRHRGTVWPCKGDVVVFAGEPGNPYGTLGVFMSREGDGLKALWEVFTQGPNPAGIVKLPVNVLVPLGWWRVTDQRLMQRDATQKVQQV